MFSELLLNSLVKSNFPDMSKIEVFVAKLAVELFIVNNSLAGFGNIVKPLFSKSELLKD